jgi:hypothetical protein
MTDCYVAKQIKRISFVGEKATKRPHGTRTRGIQSTSATAAYMSAMECAGGTSHSLPFIRSLKVSAANRCSTPAGSMTDAESVGTTGPANLLVLPNTQDTR